MKTYSKVFVTIVCLLVSITSGFAQFGESIRSGRPGQAIGPYTVGAKVFQVQSGIDFSGYDDINASGSATLFNNVFRLGLTEHFEVGAGLDYQSQETKYPTQTISQSGVSTFSLRLRSNVYEGHGLVPTIGYQFNLALPLVDDSYKANEVAPKITIVTGQDLGGGFGFTTNWGATWDGTSASPSGFYILNLGYGLTDKISLFMEQYASFDKSNFDGKIDGGVAYLVNNDLQLDLFGGYDKEGDSYSDWFVSTGVSWRMHKR